MFENIDEINFYINVCEWYVYSCLKEEFRYIVMGEMEVLVV